MEEDALNPETKKLNVSKESSLNKIGHGNLLHLFPLFTSMVDLYIALHELDSVFEEFTLSPKIQHVARQLGFADPRVLQSMVIFKQPKIGGPVPPHQDTTFLWTEPHSTIGFWFALEDCTEENGSLSFVPGSHKTVPVTRRFVRDDASNGVKFVGEETKVFPPEQYILGTCPAGNIIIANSYLYLYRESSVNTWVCCACFIPKS